MILVTSRDHLTAAMSRVGGIINKANTIPILNHVLLSARDGNLLLRATNLDMEATDAIPAEVGESGEITVSADKLADIARNLPPESVVAFKLNGDRLAVTSGRSRFSLATLPADKFPQLWLDEWPVSFEIAADVLRGMLSTVAYAQSTEASRFYLSGTYFTNKDGRLRVVATNGTVLHLCDGPEVPEFGAVILPSRMAAEMLRLLQAGDVAQIGLSDRKLMLKVGETAIVSKLIDGAFPDYERVIPKDQERRADVPISALVSAVKRTQLAAQYANGATVKLEFRSGTLSVTARSSEAEAADEIDIEYDGDDLSIGLNPAFVLETLASLSGETAHVSFGEKNDPMTWRGDGEGLGVIMPQRVG